MTPQTNFGLSSAPMSAASESLPVLEQRLAERLLAFERLDEAWSRDRTAIKCVAVRKAAKPR